RPSASCWGAAQAEAAAIAVFDAASNPHRNSRFDFPRSARTMARVSDSPSTSLMRRENSSMERRAFLSTGLGASVATLMSRPLGALAQSVADGTRWRAFEVTTRVDIPDAKGPVRVWLPLPLTPDTDYFKNLGQSWNGNAKSARVVREEKYGATMLVAEWEPGEPAPLVEVLTRFATRDRVVDWSKPGDAREDKRVLARYVEPTRLMPTDGIVARTAREITKGQKTDVDKSRALYEWIVDN